MSSAEKWEYLTGTSDVPSTLSYGIDEDERIWLHFTFDEQGYLDTPLSDFLLIFRLFNMVWYTPLAKVFNLCLNPQCHNMPYGGHVRKPDCIPMADFQRNVLEMDNVEMRRLQDAKSIVSPPPAGKISDTPLADKEPSSDN